MDIASKFGAGRIAGMREHMRQFAASFGITHMDFRDRSPNTRRVLAMAEFARDEGKLDAFRVLAMDAHWQGKKDLENDEDLKGIAKQSGLDPEKALAASRDPKYLGRIDERREEAQSIGVTGIPTFVMGNKGMVGCQPYEALAEFVEACGAKRR
jgi:predicted DsbA family dithiol-disulfide isomerase